MTNKHGRLFIISAPSGTGKTTLCKAVLNRFADMLFSVSFTTRMPRNGEQHGVDYNFISKNDFIKKIENGKWVEWAQVYGNYYGTCSESVNTGLASGKDILLDIDVQGTIQILKQYPESIAVFIIPPSIEALRHRLKSRGTDTGEIIEKRLKAARLEMEKKNLYHHVVVNDKLQEAAEELIGIIQRYRSGK